VCAALQYGMEGGGFLEELVEACKKRAACEGLCVIGEESLRGVSCDAARVVLEAFLGRWPGRVVEGFEYVCRWAKVNGGLVCGNGDVDSLVGVIELGQMRTQDLQNIVRPSGLVREADLLDMYQQRGVGEGKVEGKRLGVMKVFGSGGDGPGQFQRPNYVAVGWKDGEQRMAVSDLDLHRVLVFDVGSGECVLTLGSEEEGPESLEGPGGVAFNHRGDIIVADCEHHRICVFDWQGQFVREFGRHGAGNGEFDFPAGVAVNAHGDIIVADSGNHRVQIFGSDGAFLRSFGSRGQGDGQFDEPQGVAVGPEGMLVVADCNNSRIQVFSGVGSHVRTIGSRGEGQEQLMQPGYVGVSTHGEILVVDLQRHDVQVFSKDGVFLRLIGKDDIGTADEFAPLGVCADGEGHVFVCNYAAKNVVMLG